MLPIRLPIASCLLVERLNYLNFPLLLVPRLKPFCCLFRSRACADGSRMYKFTNRESPARTFLLN
jgi:hypothetical protein